MPYARVPCWIVTRAGTRFYLSKDPVDDAILMDICDRLASLYYPKLPAPIAEGSVILDVGAHHGFYAVEALRRYPGTRLIAIEPNLEACRLIARNLSANRLLQRTEIVEAGVGHRQGAALLEDAGVGSWGNRTIPVETVAGPGGAGKPLVRVLPIKDILRGKSPYLVKSNAEGAEYHLFPQLFSLGIFPKVVVLMLHPQYGPANNLLELFRRSGYKIHNVGSQRDLAPDEYFHCWLSREFG